MHHLEHSKPLIVDDAVYSKLALFAGKPAVVVHSIQPLIEGHSCSCLLVSGKRIEDDAVGWK